MLIKKIYSKTNCKNCGEEFIKTRKWKIFCSNYCRYDYYDKTHPRTNINDERITEILH